MWAEFRKTRAVEALRAQQLGELLLLLVLKRRGEQAWSVQDEQKRGESGNTSIFPPFSHLSLVLPIGQI